MTEVILLSGAILVIAGCLATARVCAGPSLLDRVVALDMLLAIIVCGLAILAASTRDSTIVSVLVVVGLLGFIGSVSIVRFLDKDSSER